MADDEVRPVPEPQRSGPTTPDEARPGEHTEARHAPETPLSTEPPMPVSEPTMAAAGADLSAEREGEEASRAEPIRAEPRSVLPAALSAIGIVLIALLGFNLYLMLYPPNRDLLPELQTEIAGLRQRVAAVETRPSGLAPVDAKLKALDGSLARLSSEVAEVRSAQPVSAAAAPDGRVDDLGKSVAELKATVAALPRTDLAPIESRLAALGADIEAVKASMAALPKVDLGPLDRRVAALDDRLKPIEAEFSAPKAALQVTEARREGSAAETRAAPLAVTAQAVLRALDDGQPFGPELAALTALGADAKQVGVLKPVADKGAPTRGALISGFAAVRDGLVAATVPKVTGTVLDRMMASAQGLVQVRATGATAGTGPDAIASRVAAALDRGAFGEALAEWDRLPEASKAVSAAWAEGLRERVAAETAARAIASTAITAIGAER